MLTIMQEIGDHAVGYQGDVGLLSHVDKLPGDSSTHTQK